MAANTLGALRVASRIRPRANSPPAFTLVQCRSFPALRPSSHFARAMFNVGIGSHTLNPSVGHRRFLSLGSIFSPRAKPPSTPSPTAIGLISKLEGDANTNPHDVAKQLALFHALTNTGVKPGYDVVITRWERMCEFDSVSPLLRSDEAFQLYLTSLVKVGHESSIDPAVRRRDSLLASTSASAPLASTSAPTPLTTVSAASEATPSSTVPPASDLVASALSAPVTPVAPSASQKVADAVLSGQTPVASTPSAAQNLSPDLAKLATALGGGAGIPGNPIHVTLAEPKGAWIPKLVRFTILTALTGVFFLIVLAVLLENSGLLKAGGPRAAEFEPNEGKVYKFSDVHGVDEAKEELQDIVEFLKDPTMFSTLGGKLPKGVLLTGPPGTGKTLLARAVAGEAGVPFLFASGSEFDEMFVGVGAKRVRDLFATARKKQPAIIFIDELDAIGGKRSSRDQHYMKQTLNQLLVEMDGFQQDEGVIVIAATNFPESLDQALVRPGRFDRHVAVPLPDIRGRAQILVHFMKEVTTSPGADPMVLARGTPGFSGADLQNMVNQAAIQASKESCKDVTLKHFEWAKDRIIMGAESKSRYIDTEVKRMTAYHEGGHALVALYTEGAMPLHKVTCVPRGHALGVTSQLPQNDRVSVSLKEYLAEIDVSMGGRVAEELIYGPENVTSGASSDLQKASATARRMVKYWGYSPKVGPVFHGNDDDMSPSKREEIESEVRDMLIAGESRVMKLLDSKKDELHRLADALMEHETLDMDEVKNVIQGKSIRRIEEVVGEDIARMSTEPEPSQ